MTSEHYYSLITIFEIPFNVTSACHTRIYYNKNIAKYVYYYIKCKVFLSGRNDILYRH